MVYIRAGSEKKRQEGSVSTTWNKVLHKIPAIRSLKKPSYKFSSGTSACLWHACGIHTSTFLASNVRRTTIVASS